VTIDIDELKKLTSEYGGEWGVNHAKRIVHLVSVIGEELRYDASVIEIAAYLHDWGGYSKWAVAGTDHAVLSAQVVAAYAKEHKWPEETTGPVLECILRHHTGGEGRIIESVLFTDADALDLIGVIGFARIFSMWPKNLKGAVDSVKKWRAQTLSVIQNPKAKELAEARVSETDKLLARFEEEAFGAY